LQFEQLDSSGQLAMLQREQAEAAQEVLKHADGTKESYEAQETLADKTLQVLKKIEQVQADTTAEEKEQLSLLNQQREAALRLANAHQSIANAKASGEQALGDRSRLTLDEAANMPVMNRYAAEVAALAKRAAALEQQAGLYRAHGRADRADDMANEALAIRQRLEPVLKSAEADPMAGVRAAVEASQEALQSLLDLSQSSGLVVQPRNGP
jgi:hypothetical protein